MRKQAGFTLIELVVVLVLLGILGAVATGTFQDLSSEARAAALSGIAAELSSASALNYAEGVANNNTFPISVTSSETCATVAASLMSAGALPNGWSMQNGTANPGCTGAGTSDSTCILENDAVTTVNTNVNLICTGS